jgi:hypothetical protein
MTVCIAAACGHEDEPRIVLCHDWQQEIEGLGSSETRNKMDWVKDGWPVLEADLLNRAESLIRIYVDHLANVDLTEENVFSEMKVPAQQFKGILADDYIRQLLGIDYNYFLQYGKERFPADFFREKMNEVSQITLGASLIIAGFVPCKKIGPYSQGLSSTICVVEDSLRHNDTVRIETDFAAIGSGSDAAIAAMFHRGQHWERNLMYTIYSVFEAKRYAEGVPGVGPDIVSIDVLEPQNVIRSLSDAGYEYCESLWTRFGPRAMREKHKAKFEMKDEYLEPFSTTGDEW